MSSEMQENRLHLLVKGRVQGVGFRYFSYMAGVDHQLNGWVRNRINGDVEILAEGSRDKLDSFLKVIRQGPEMAQVIDVDIQWDEVKGDLPPFTIRSTN